MTFLHQTLSELTRAGATVAYCTRVSPGWVMVHAWPPVGDQVAMATRLALGLRGAKTTLRRITIAEGTER